MTQNCTSKGVTKILVKSLVLYRQGSSIYPKLIFYHLLMNRSLFALALAFGLALTAPSAIAADTHSNDGSTFHYQVEAQKALEAAIRTRQIRHLAEIRRGHSSRDEKFAQHQYNLFRNNVDTRATFLDRSGEYLHIPHYPFRRSSSLTPGVPNNAKRNLRARAIDYYGQGGQAGVDALTEGVILGSEHSIVREYFNKQFGGRQGYADLISELRDQQRDNFVNGKATRLYPFSYRIGASRNYLHPYMRLGQ